MPRVKNTRFRVVLNSISALVLLTFVYGSSFVQKGKLRSGFENGVRNRHRHGRFTLEIPKPPLRDPQICAELLTHEGFATPCDYLTSHPECDSGGYFNYMKFLYCDCKNYLFLGYLALGIWLVILFYLLGNTASDYFCCSLEKLSSILKLSPTVAGVTLLPLGNGSPDVFASIAAFVGNSSGDVGLNGVLGASVFVTCVVVGVVSLSVAEKRVRIDRKCFIRDLCFSLFTLLCLTLILVLGKVNIWIAMGFVSIYVLYAFFIILDEVVKNKGGIFKFNGWAPLLPMNATSLPSLENHDDVEPPKLPHISSNRVRKPDVRIDSDYIMVNNEDSSSQLWGWKDEDEDEEEEVINESSSFSFANLWSILEMPMGIPRRLTIPIVEEDRWSKFYAVASATIAPIIMAFLWNTQEDITPLSVKIAYIAGSSAGSILGLLAFIYTSTEHPPRRYLFPWVFGGFLMSIVWFYLVANELVALLVSLGLIFGISPSILALTILAWGNSMGDLMANTALALNQRDGVQIAISGSYAGPMFNTLIGLGIPLLLGGCSAGSDPYVVPSDSSLFITLGFLAAGLIWALIVLPLSDMQPNKFLGVGLITIYFMFLAIRIGTSLGST